MLDFMFAMIAAGASTVSEPETSTTEAPLAAIQETAPAQSSPTVSVGENVQIGQGVVIGGANQTVLDAVPALPKDMAGPAVNQSVIPAGLTAEPQIPTGRFTTAAEVRPILEATKGNWVAIREYDGHDLVYVSHIWAWRCGMKAMAISINDEPMQNWPLPACHEEYSTPNALLDGDPLPFLKLRLGGVKKVTVQLVLDDLSTEVAEFNRADILSP